MRNFSIDAVYDDIYAIHNEGDEPARIVVGEEQFRAWAASAEASVAMHILIDGRDLKLLSLPVERCRETRETFVIGDRAAASAVMSRSKSLT
jgi:hypothetical protein